ncbi:MAG TPA: cob(I)yrinic acid a,c-diamide adenosyltransferase [Feifaniaceae bacterium]|nr:cob(I)yrinic acid a,c-diamide adenosyltransferase [Feifaniaceae bacterium]
MKRGLTHVYYGDGKGKTTAALGLGLRAWGAGLRVVLVQFLKDFPTGELKALEALEGFAVLRGKAPGKLFSRDMSGEEKRLTKAVHDANLERAAALVNEGKCDLLILDEALDALRLGLLEETVFRRLVCEKPEGLELVVTGHAAEGWVLEHADYVTELIKRKHPYDKGVPARKGIEF